MELQGSAYLKKSFTQDLHFYYTFDELKYTITSKYKQFPLLESLRF